MSWCLNQSIAHVVINLAKLKVKIKEKLTTNPEFQNLEATDQEISKMVEAFHKRMKRK